MIQPSLENGIETRVVPTQRFEFRRTDNQTCNKAFLFFAVCRLLLVYVVCAAEYKRSSHELAHQTARVGEACMPGGPFERGVGSSTVSLFYQPQRRYFVSPFQSHSCSCDFKTHTCTSHRQGDEFTLRLIKQLRCEILSLHRKPA